MAWVDLVSVAERPILEVAIKSGGIALPNFVDHADPSAASGSFGNPNPSFIGAGVTSAGGTLYRVVDPVTVGSIVIPNNGGSFSNDPVYNYSTGIATGVQLQFPVTATPNWEGVFSLNGVTITATQPGGALINKTGISTFKNFYNDIGVGLFALDLYPGETYIYELALPNTLNLYNATKAFDFDINAYLLVIDSGKYYFAGFSPTNTVGIMTIAQEAFVPGGGTVNYIKNNIVFDNPDLNNTPRVIGQDGEYFIFTCTNDVDKTFIMFVKFDGSTYRAYSFGVIENIATDWQKIWGFKE